MPRPTTAQLRKINKFSQSELKEEQVFVFRSLSADTLPISRQGWFGEYSINLSEKMLQKLRKDYQKGVGLLASHKSNRLPFGRTFDAEILADEVDGESVKTLYIDHYMVTHMEDSEGNKVPLQTEIGMTTQDIANHIEVGHTFDTSIGFAIHDPKCTVCNNSLYDYDKCEHIPGLTYTVDGEQVRCDILVDSGEGVENSLVYAGAVDRAIIQRAALSQNSSENSETLHSPVKVGDVSLYNVDELKNLPKGADLFCFLSKGNLQLFTTTPERRDFTKFQKGSEEMSKQAQTTETQELANVTAETIELAADVVAKGEFDAVVAQRDKLDGELQTALSKVQELGEQLEEANKTIEGLTEKAELADQFTEDLIESTVKAGVAARGNAFNKERYEKYLRTLSVSEIKEELSAMKGEFAGGIEAAAQATQAEVETERNEGRVEMSKAEMRQEAARIAFQRYKQEGGDLEKLTKQALAELESAK